MEDKIHNTPRQPEIAAFLISMHVTALRRSLVGFRPLEWLVSPDTSADGEGSRRREQENSERTSEEYAPKPEPLSPFLPEEL